MSLNKTDKHLSNVKIPLRHLAKWQEDDLIKRMNCERLIYNSMLNKLLKRMKQMENIRLWRDLIKEIDDLYKEIRDLKNSKNKDNLKLAKDKEKELKELYKKKDEILKDYGFSQFDFINLVADFNCYKENINSMMAIIGVALPLWEGFQDRYYPKKLSKDGNLPMPKFKTIKFRDMMSLVSDNKSGIRFTEGEKDGKKGYFLILSNQQATKKKNEIFIPNTDLNDYQKEALCNKIKRVMIKPKQVKNKTKFDLIVTYAGLPPITYDKDGNEKHPFNKTGLVSISIYRDTICAVSKDEVFVTSFLPDTYKELEDKKSQCDQKMSHLRFVNNSQNYYPDGRIRRAITRPNGQKMRKKWFRSENYMKEVRKKSELFRIECEQKELKQWEICNHILGMGDEFVAEDISFDTRKELWNEEVGKIHSDEEYKRLKEERKIIASVAPSALLTKINNRLKQMDLEEIRKIKIPKEYRWYKHDTGISEVPLTKMITVEDKTLPQTVYRAFLLSHISEEKDSFYNEDSLKKDFPNFIEHFKCLEH